MSGPAVVRAVLTADSGLTALVPADRIVADEVAPQDTALPFILLKHVSGVDYHPVRLAGSIHTRKRVQIEVHAKNALSLKAIKAAVRNAVHSNQLPTVSGYVNLTLHTEGEGPEFITDQNIRIGVQDVMATYAEQIT